MRKLFTKARLAILGASCAAMLLVGASVAFAADGDIDFTPVTSQFTGVAAALSAGVVAAIVAALAVSAIIKGSPAVWKMFWKFVGR